MYFMVKYRIYSDRAKTKSGNLISSGTASSYFNKVRAVINPKKNQLSLTLPKKFSINLTWFDQESQVRPP